MKKRAILIVVSVGLLVVTSLITGLTAAERSSGEDHARASSGSPTRTEPAGAQTGPSEVTILITEQGFDQAKVAIKAGQSVSWVNQTSVVQRLLGQESQKPRVFLPLLVRGQDGPGASPEAPVLGQDLAGVTSFSSDIPPGGSYTQAFPGLGSFDYFIVDQPDWTGRLTVGPAGDDVPIGNLIGFEPHTAVVSPRNPNLVAVVRGCTLMLSTDFGVNFAQVPFTCPIPPSLNGLGINIRPGGDPVLAFDSQDRLYWAYLLYRDNNNNNQFDGGAEDRSIVVARIDNLLQGAGSATMPMTGAVDIAPLGAGAVDSDDKPWIAVDTNPASPYTDFVYVVWSRNRANTWDVLFSRSTNGGVTFSPQVQPIAGNPGMDWPASIAVAANGDVYAAYHADECGRPPLNNQNSLTAVQSSVVVLRDSSGGLNLAQGNAVPTSSFRAAISCNRQDLPGIIPGSISWLQGSNQPTVLPDPVRPGHIYVIANDDPDDNFGNGDDGDVVMARSTDYGASWTRSTISHAPAGTLQIMPSGAIDQDGNLFAFWYDTRMGQSNAAGNFLLDVFASVSRDGGRTFSNDFQINDAAFDPDLGAPCRLGPGGVCLVPRTNRIGEYNGAAAANGIGYVVWTGNSAAGGQQTIFDLFSILGAFPDRLEPNESIDFAVAAALGSDDTYNEPGLTIHSATDVDFFKVVALHTGKLEVEIEFNTLIDELDLRVHDRFSNNDEIAAGTMITTQIGSNQKMLALPVVQGEIYFVEVCSQEAAVCNDNATGTSPPQSTYDLTIVNRRAPVPFSLDLTTDTGGDDSDNLTSDTTPTMRLRVDDLDFLETGIEFSPTNDENLADDNPGFKVRIYDNGNPVDMGFATQVANQPGVYQFTFPEPLPDGYHSITSRVVMVDPSDDPNTTDIDHFFGPGGESEALQVTIDSSAPVCSPASAPDLLDSSDDAGINVDNITTIMAPAFSGTAGANVIVHILANGDIVGTGSVGPDDSDGVSGDGMGAYEVTVEPLRDGVYDIETICVSEAGVVSEPSPALQVIIANKELNLSGATADVVVDLADDMFAGSPSTVTGYPDVAGGTAGIDGIPVVNLDVNGQALDILGTALDDNLTFSPTGPQGGKVVRAESAQILNLSGIGGPFTIDPLDGIDSLSVNGTAIADVIAATVDVIATVQVNSLQAVRAPIASTEWLEIRSAQGEDAIDVTVFDTVNAFLYVDAGTPATTNPVGDVLTVIAGSDRGQLQKQPGGPVTGAGSVFVTYPHTTDTNTRIDYEEVESVTLIK